MDKLVKWLEDLIRAQKKSRAWRTFVSCLAAIVVFTTTYSLILPAITVESTATEDVGGLVMEGTDAGSTGAQAEAPGEVVTVDAENEIPEEPVQEEVPAEETTPAEEVAAEETSAEETAAETPASSSETGTAQPAASQTVQTAESAAAVTEEVREPVNGEVQTIGDKRVMTLKGDDFDVVVSGDLSVGVSDRTVLSVRGIADAEVVKSYSDRIAEELLKIFVDKKTTEVMYQLVFTDENLVEYTPAGHFDVQLIFHKNTVSHTGEKIYAAIYDYLTDEMVLAEKNGDEYETPVISLDEYGIIKGITLKGMHFDEYSDIITLVAGPVNEELKLAAEKAAEAAATESKSENAESADSKTEKTESAEKTDSAEKTESADAKTDSAESKVEGPSTKAETSKGSEATESGTLTARGTDYTVTLSYGAEAKIPAGASLEVSEIENGTKAYKKYLAQAKAAMGLDEDQELPKEQARFFDIKIMADGKEVQPTANVSVNITYDQPVVEADPNTEAQIDASAVHFGKKGAEVVEVSEADAACVEFEAESFSVYGVIYTVDFEYTDPITGQVYYYSLEGGKSINLTELLVLLGIKTEENVEEFVANQVENVEFSDSELVKVSHKGKILGIFGTEDWKLESLKPFTTEETLTISLNNGDEIVVKVTDALSYETDIKPMLTSATIEGADKNEQGAYVIKSGVPYNVHFTFEEVPNGMQFKTDGPITYQLPAGFSALLSSGTATITGNHGENVEADYVINNGLITLTWKNTDSADFQTFANSEYGVINLDIEGVFDDNVTEIKFSDTVTADVVIDHTSDVSVSKKGTFNPETKQIDYTVYVTSTGNNSEIKVQDTISGTALTYAGNFNIESNKSSNVPYRTDPSYQGTNGFGIIIPEMQSGEIITITYSANVDFTRLTKNDDGSYGTVEQTGNGVKVKSEHTPEHEDKKSGKDLENKIEISTLDKSAGEITDAGNGKKTITWTIRINEQKNISLAGKTLTDIIAENSRQFMSYSGTGIRISRSDGQTYDVDWGASGNHGNLTNAYGGSTWTYTFPENEEIFAYTITYTTEVDADKIVVATTLNNTSNFEYDNDSAGKKVEPDGTEVTGEKRAVNTNLEKKETTWQIDFTVPEKGLTSAVVTDTYPYFTGDASIRDTLKEGSIKVYEEVNGVWVEFDTSQGERYDPVTSDPKKAVITFYKTVDGVETTGLIGKGSVRNIRVELTTVANPAFIEKGEQYDYAKTHTNNANIKVNGQDIDKSAEVVLDFTEKTIKKSNIIVAGTQQNQSFWQDGKQIPAFGYCIELTGVNDSAFDENGELKVEDTFDSNYLTYKDLSGNWWNDQNAKVQKDNLGNNTWRNVGDTKDCLTFDGNNKLTFTLKKSDLIENGLYAKKYKIQYFLVPKDFENMQSTALNSEGLKVSFDNSVSAEKFGDDTITTEYEADVLQKEATNAQLNQDTGNYEVKFTLKVNKDKLKIGDEDTVTLKDTFTNLSMDYTTIKVYEMNEWGNKGSEVDDVVINRSGFTTIFTLKNEHSYIIEYTGRVIGSGPVHWKNLADIEGLKRTKEGDATISSSGSGSFTNYNMKVLKYADGDMTKGLAATFALYEKEGDGDWKLSEQYGSFTTNEDGQFSLENLRKYEDRPGRRFQYYILETVAPEGFKKDDTHYEFRIGDTADYPNRIYLNDDVVTIVNKPKTEDTTITVDKQWFANADDAHAGTPEKKPPTQSTIYYQIMQKIGDYDATVYEYNGRPVQSLSYDTSSEDWGKVTHERLPARVNVGSTAEPDWQDAVYYVVECNSDGTALTDTSIEVTYAKNGGQAGEAIDAAVGAEDDERVVTIINTDSKKDFEFSKEWYGSDGTTIKDWPIRDNRQIPIQVTLTRKLVTAGGQEVQEPEESSDSATYSLTPDSAEQAGWSVTVDNKIYTFKIEDLDRSGKIGEVTGEWQYFVTEAYLDGYNTEYYLKDSTTKQNPDRAYTNDGGKIKNLLAPYKLPNTGGFGTRPFHTIGLLLIGLASGMYAFLNRKKLVLIRSNQRIDGFERDENRRGGGDGL